MDVFSVLLAYSSISPIVFFKFILRQYCRTHSLELHTGTRSAITAMRGAAGSGHPAVAKSTM